MTYRSDLDALEARKVTIEAALAAQTRERDEVARMVDEARALATAEATFAPRSRAWYVRKSLWAAVAMLAVAIGGIAAYRATRSVKLSESELMMARFEGFARDMCACRDKPCADHLSDEMTKVSQELDMKPAHAPKLDDAQTKRATVIGERVGECMQRAMSVPIEKEP